MYLNQKSQNTRQGNSKVEINNSKKYLKQASKGLKFQKLVQLWASITYSFQQLVILQIKQEMEKCHKQTW